MSKEGYSSGSDSDDSSDSSSSQESGTRPVVRSAVQRASGKKSEDSQKVNEDSSDDKDSSEENKRREDSRDYDRHHRSDWRDKRDYRSRDDRHRDRREDSRGRDRDDYRDRRTYDRRDNVDDRRRYRDNRHDSRERERGRNDRRYEQRNEDDNKENKTDDRESGRKRKSDWDRQDDSAQTKGSDEPAAKKNKTENEKKAGADTITTRTGGAYIPPAKLRMMQEQITDKSSLAYQRMAWEALKKSINGLINKVNVSNIINIVRELFQENIVRGRGLLARSIIQAQAASPTFTHVYACLVAIINTKFPQNGELILRRLVIQFRKGFKRNDKNLCLSSTRFIAHLVNQQVAHEVIALEILTLLLENPTDDSVEVTIGFLKECGQKLSEVSPRGINAIFERLRSVLHEGQIDTRVQYMVEVMFAIRKDGFKDHPAILTELDLVEETDQFTHLLTLEDAGTPEDLLNVFRQDPEYLENEEKYKTLKKEILDESSSGEESGSEDGSESSEDSDEEDDEEDEEGKQTIIDSTETNLVALRRTIYLTIQSSLDFEECAHKLLKMELKPGQEVELCNMILDCCAQLRTYEKFFGLLAQRFCQIDKKYIEPFQNTFKEQYDTIHRLETNKLRNVAKFFSHLLHTDAISWGVLCCIKLNEDDTTSASRIFVKILFQELSEYMGLPKLNDRLKDPTLQPFFEGIMPRDNPRNTRFAINFFTTIGLGGLTDDLREHLKTMTKQIMQQKQEAAEANDESSSSSDESSDSEDNQDSSDDSSSNSGSDGSDSNSESGSESSSSTSSADSSQKRTNKKQRAQQKIINHNDNSKNGHPKGDREEYRHIENGRSKPQSQRTRYREEEESRYRDRELPQQQVSEYTDAWDRRRADQAKTNKQTEERAKKRASRHVEEYPRDHSEERSQRPSEERSRRHVNDRSRRHSEEKIERSRRHSEERSLKHIDKRTQKHSKEKPMRIDGRERVSKGRREYEEDSRRDRNRGDSPVVDSRRQNKVRYRDTRADQERLRNSDHPRWKH